MTSGKVARGRDLPALFRRPWQALLDPGTPHTLIVAGNFQYYLDDNKMRLVLLYILLITLVCCEREASKRELLSSKLERTFTDSKTEMSDFMSQWSKDSESLKNNSPNELESNLFGIHKEIFSPFNFELFGWDKWTDWTPFTGTKYIVVQSQIPYKIVDQIDKIKSEYDFVDTLKHFYPGVHFDNVTTLYLDNEYQNIFIKFLGDPTNEAERTTFREKKDFLDNTLALSHGYNWRVILTQPIINGICVSKDFKEAIVDFNIVSSGLRSYLFKENEKWTIKTTREAWIE